LFSIILKIYYLKPTLSHMTIFYFVTTHFFKTHFNIILLPTFRSLRWRLTPGFPPKMLRIIFPSCTTCSTHFSTRHWSNLTIFGDE